MRAVVLLHYCLLACSEHIAWLADLETDKGERETEREGGYKRHLELPSEPEIRVIMALPLSAPS